VSSRSTRHSPKEIIEDDIEHNTGDRYRSGSGFRKPEGDNTYGKPQVDSEIETPELREFSRAIAACCALK
jgi:hypothetical protein